MNNGEPPRCDTWAACVPHDGERIEITGVYTLYRPFVGHKGADDVTLVRVIPDGGKRGPFLEPYWRAEAARDPAEMARLDGKRVTVLGRLYLTPPPAPDDPGDAASLGGACIHPVERIELVE
jgi:hypothetical protein